MKIQQFGFCQIRRNRLWGPKMFIAVLGVNGCTYQYQLISESKIGWYCYDMYLHYLGWERLHRWAGTGRSATRPLPEKQEGEMIKKPSNLNDPSFTLVDLCCDLSRRRTWRTWRATSRASWASPTVGSSTAASWRSSSAGSQSPDSVLHSPSRSFSLVA